MIARAIAPDAGNIINRCVKISYLFIDVGFIQHPSGIENAILSGMLHGMKGRCVVSKKNQVRKFWERGDFLVNI